MTISSLTGVTHVLHVRHALSRGAVPGLRATLVPPTPWWYGARLTPAGDLAVLAADRFPDDASAPVVRLSVTDPMIAAGLAEPLVEITLSQAEQTHEFAPAAQTVTVTLVTRAGTTATGNTVTLVAQAGPAIDLPELDDRLGSYRSVPRTWTTAQLTFDIRAGDVVVGHYRLHPYALDTRLHGVVA